MPKFDEYPTEATPTDDDTMLIFENTSKKNKQTPFSGLWNWMVGKLTDAVIDNLTTESKTVFGAINELNSKISTEYYNIPAGQEKYDFLFDIHKKQPDRTIYAGIVRIIDSDDTGNLPYTGVYLMLGYRSSISPPNGFGAQLFFTYGGGEILINRIMNENHYWTTIKGTTTS